MSVDMDKVGVMAAYCNPIVYVVHRPRSRQNYSCNFSQVMASVV